MNNIKKSELWDVIDSLQVTNIDLKINSTQPSYAIIERNKCLPVILSAIQKLMEELIELFFVNDKFVNILKNPFKIFKAAQIVVRFTNDLISNLRTCKAK